MLRMVNREDFWQLYMNSWMLHEQKSIHTTVFLPLLALFSLLCLNIYSGGWTIFWRKVWANVKSCMGTAIILSNSISRNQFCWGKHMTLFTPDCEIEETSGLPILETKCLTDGPCLDPTRHLFILQKCKAQNCISKQF